MAARVSRARQQAAQQAVAQGYQYLTFTVNGELSCHYYR
jgi:hypothetical protein